MAVFAKTFCTGDCSGVSFLDSTPLRECNTMRIFNHKPFDRIATRGKSTRGYYYGFKLHIVVKDLGQIIDFQITQANVDGRAPLKNNLLKKIWGKLFADKGYISKVLCQALFHKGVHITTGVRKNMKNTLMPINDKLKNICQKEHSRHRSFKTLSRIFSQE